MSPRRATTLPRTLLLLPLLLLLPGAGCARCSSSSRAQADAGPEIPLVPNELPAPPRAWTFGPASIEGTLAPPERCKLRARLVRATVARTTRFAADPRSLATLIIADSAADPPRLTGVAGLTLDPSGETRDAKVVPWFALGAVPRMARSGGAWVGGFDQTLGPGDSRVGLWRDGAAEHLGRGDTFESADMVCAGPRCALLTSRLGNVARPGATLWIGSPAEPAAHWRQVEIAPDAGDGNARPIGIAGLSPEGAITVALADKSEVALWIVADGAPRESARVPAPHGVLDVVTLPLPVALTFGSPVDENGCAQDAAASVKFERPGLAPAEVKAPAPPIGGFVRRLARGAIAAWLAPLVCQKPRRVVYAVVLDEQGKPVSEPMAVGDAASFAIASEGDDVDLYVQDEDFVTWARLSCTAP